MGVALKDEILTAMVENKRDRKIAEFTRKVGFVPESIHADQLLRAFQKSRNHLVVVVDEYGTVYGVVTLEDVLEILTDEIVDKTDRIIELQAAARNRLARMLKM